MSSLTLNFPRRNPHAFLLIATFVGVVASGIMLVGFVFNGVM